MRKTLPLLALPALEPLPCRVRSARCQSWEHHVCASVSAPPPPVQGARTPTPARPKPATPHAIRNSPVGE